MSEPGGLPRDDQQVGSRAGSGLWEREIDVSFLWRTPAAHPVGVILALGVLLRVAVYLGNRGYWLDEGTLLGNIEGVAPLSFAGPLRGDQLAPFGFLVIERLLVGWFGASGYVTRLVPVACGIGSLWLFKGLSLRWLSFPAALVALVMFSLSDDLIYYSSELKPYSSDLLVSLAVVTATARAAERPLGPRSLAGLGLLVTAAPWLSFPSAFTIAGAGLALLADRLVLRRWSDCAWLAVVACAWLASFALAYRSSHALLHEATSMYVFWNFAFLAAPPRDAAAWRTFGGVLLEVFVNPLNLLPPALPAWLVLIPSVLIAAGAWALGRRNRTVLLILALPVALAVLAAAARRYPFHGRLILGLVPAFFLLLAEGLDRIRATLGCRAFVAAAIVLLLHPFGEALYESSGERIRDFNPHGDIHRNRFVP
jgi:hypothetical protein